MWNSTTSSVEREYLQSLVKMEAEKDQDLDWLGSEYDNESGSSAGRVPAEVVPRVKEEPVLVEDENSSEAASPSISSDENMTTAEDPRTGNKRARASGSDEERSAKRHC